jgi:uncharacterized protein YggU (UPF0235/DUF167 family)
LHRLTMPSRTRWRRNTGAGPCLLPGVRSRANIAAMRINVRVQTRSRLDLVGGRYGTADPPTLIVRVRAAPHGGHANAACLKILAEALDVPRQAVTIVAGARAKSKIVEVEGADPTRLHTFLGISE